FTLTLCLAARAQTVAITPLLPSAASGVATAPGTVTINGAQGQGKGNVTAGLPGSLPIIDCPYNKSIKCLGPAVVTITHTLSGFGRFLISTSDDGLKPVQVGTTLVQQCSVSEGAGGTPAP